MQPGHPISIWKRSPVHGLGGKPPTFEFPVSSLGARLIVFGSNTFVLAAWRPGKMPGLSLCSAGQLY